LLLVILLLAACGNPTVLGPVRTSSDALIANATVMRDIDGDTVDVRIGRRRERVRLIGVNTPETVDPRRPVECFGPEAKQATKHLLPPGTPVRLERDAEPRDDYGRLLVYLYRATDGRFINLDLVAQGFAVPLRIAPNTAHATEFAAAARSAEQASLGLWSACPR
jgi:micrococcal nuclease